MGAIVSRNGSSLSERQIQNQLARQLGNMDLAIRVNKAGLAEIGSVHSYASRKVLTTLETANQLLRAASYAGRVSAIEEERYQQLTSEYLNEMTQIVADAGDRIISHLTR